MGGEIVPETCGKTVTGIAIPSYLALRNRARIQATRSEMQNIATAIAVYEADIEHFPIAADMAAMIILVEAGDYMANMPLLDAWGNAYTYVSATPGATYVLSSTGGGVTPIVMTDGVFGGE